MSTKLVYLFSEVTNELIGSTVVAESPLEPGIFNTPVHSTDIVPPAFAINEVPVFTNGAWAVQPDFRFTQVYDANGDPFEVTTIGPLPVGKSLTKPVPPVVVPVTLTLAETRAKQIHVINAACQTALSAITDPYPFGETLTWPMQYSEALAYTANNAASTPTITAIVNAALAAGGNPVNYTVAKVVSAVLLKASAYTSASGAVIGKRQALTDAINAAADIASVEAIVW